MMDKRIGIVKDPIPLSTILTSVLTPVTLITGVAFLTSIMAPRFGRCIDRVRTILFRLKALSSKDREYSLLILQLKVLFNRTRVLRNTMVAAGVCILCVVVTIAVTFASVLAGAPDARIAIVPFGLALLSLIILVLGFIYDFVNSLQAVKLEILCDLNLDDLQFVSKNQDVHDLGLSLKVREGEGA